MTDEMYENIRFMDDTEAFKKHIKLYNTFIYHLGKGHYRDIAKAVSIMVHICPDYADK